MDSGSAGSKNQLLYVDVHVDKLEPRQGILDILRRLRPQWKAQDIQIKASDWDPRVISICISIIIIRFRCIKLCQYTVLFIHHCLVEFKRRADKHKIVTSKSLEANPGSIFSRDKCDVRTPSADTQIMEFTAKYEISCVQLCNEKYLHIHRIWKFKVGIYAIFQDFNVVIILYCVFLQQPW